MRYGSDKVAFFLIGGLDVVGTLTEFDDRREAAIERSDGLGKQWQEHSFVGVREGEITQSGFYDDAAGSANDAFSSGPGSTAILSYCLEGTATGAEFVGWSGGVQVNYERQAQRDELTKAKAVYRNGGVIEQGLVLHTYKAVGTTGLKGIVDLGATSTGLVGYLHHNASAGEANVRIVHSASAGTASYSALITFSRISSGHGAQRVVATGDVNRYVAVDFTTATATGAIGALNAFVGVVL
jgi:hypothetical protein